METTNLPLDIGLNLRGLQRASVASRLDHLRNQLGVLNGLAALHDAHNGRLRLKVPVCGYSLVRRLVLLLGLFQLDLVDLDAELGVGEPAVVREFIRRVDILALWVLGQDPILGTCERLEGSFQLRIRCMPC